MGLKMFTLLCLAAMCLMSSADVHRFEGSYVRALGDHPDMDANLADRLHLPMEKLNKLASFGKVNVVGSLDVAKSSYVALVANVTVGTPSQELTVLLQYWSSSDINILGDHRKGVVSPDHFNSSASSTFESRNQSSYVFGGRSYVVGDNIKIGSASLTNVTFNLIESRFYSFVRLVSGISVSGNIGLVPSDPSDNTSTSFVEQIVDQLDEPLVTLASGETGIGGNGTARITLGGLDSDNCEDDFVYAPVSLSSLTKTVNVSSVSASLADGTVLNTVSVNGTLVITPAFPTVVVSPRILELLINATQAEYNSTLGVYKVECTEQDGGKLSLNLGNGDADNALVLNGKDFVTRYNDICYLGVTRGYRRTNKDYIVVGTRFLTNHCITQNITERTLGIGSAKST